MKKEEFKLTYKIKESNNNLKTKEIITATNNKINSILKNKNISFQNTSIIFNNLKKHSITIKKYNTFIINSIIFDQKKHIVIEFKNYLLWDESSEFLKRFYKLFESIERLPNISQYYESYTLFAPIYYGFISSLVIIMNEWTRKKRDYLEYIEDKEEKEEDIKKKNKNNEKNVNYKKIIKSNLMLSKSSDTRSNHSKTLDLTKYDNIDSFFIKDNIDLSLIEIDKKNNTKKQSLNNISLPKIMDNLSSNNSICNSKNYNKTDEDKSKIKNNYIKAKKKEVTKKDKDKDKNIVLSDKIIFSFINLYKNRNNKFIFQKKIKKNNNGVNNNNNNSTSKVKKSQIHEKNKERMIRNKMRSIINLPLNDSKNSSIKKKFIIQNNNLQIAINNYTRNKNSKEKKDKDNNRKHALTNTNIKMNVTSYNNSTNNSLSKLKVRKQKIKKLYLRNLKIITPPYKGNGPRMYSPVSNTLESNQNDNTNNNSKKNKCNLTRLLTYKDGKYKNYLINGNNINIKNFNSYGYIKVNRTQTNYDPFSNKINRLIKDKRVITSTNSFSNNKNKNNNNSKYDKRSLKNTKNKNKTNFILLNKKISNGNLIRNLVLNQFNSKKEIMHKTKNNLNNFYLNNNMPHHKMTSSLTSNHNTSLKNTKGSLTSKYHKKLNDSICIKPYKKELNKINLNFNFNINFNIDINKNRQKKYLIAYKNNMGCITQRNQILKRYKKNKRSKSRGGEILHKKNTMSALVKNMNNDNNTGLRRIIKQLK